MVVTRAIWSVIYRTRYVVVDVVQDPNREWRRKGGMTPEDQTCLGELILYDAPRAYRTVWLRNPLTPVETLALSA